MIEQGKGEFVNISSGASLLATPQAAITQRRKAGVNNLTGSMASAWTRTASGSTPSPSEPWGSNAPRRHRS
jgi:short-subunit dehydrogenase